jgi:hypothetical protein
MKLVYIKKLLYLTFLAGSLNVASVRAEAKELDPVEKTVATIEVLLKEKCQNLKTVEALNKVLEDFIAWGKDFVDFNNKTTKAVFLIQLKAYLDRVYDIIQDITETSKLAGADKEVKKAYAKILNLLQGIHKNIKSIYTIIQQYNDSTAMPNLLMFGSKLMPYQPFLPKTFREMKRPVVIDALSHRFSCKEA